MYWFLVFLHVISAVFLGSFLALPFTIQSLAARTEDKLKMSVNTVLYFTRFGHYALILLFLSGGGMVIGYGSYPSMLWVTLSTIILIVIGGLMGVISKRMKLMKHTESLEEALQENLPKLKILSWVTFVLIIIAVFIMTNRQLFS